MILTPKRAPNGNAYAERFVLSIKSECLNRMIFFGERRKFARSPLAAPGQEEDGEESG